MTATETAAPPVRAARARPTPALGLAVAALVAIAVVVGAVVYAVGQPWLGLTLRFDEQAGGARVLAAEGPAAALPVGTVLTHAESGGVRLRLERTDLTGQVDGSFGPFADYQRFMARQGQFAEMMRAPEMVFTDASGRRWTVSPDARGRPIGSLGADFWIGMVVGAVAWLIAAAIFVFRPHETPARYVLLSGIACLLFIPVGPLYTSRELGLPAFDFYLINGANFLGGSLYAAATFALLLYYPSRLAPRWAGWAVIGVFLVWYAAQAWGLFPDLTFARRFLVFCALAGALVLSAVHWRRTRRDPVARAALAWFVLSWVLVVSVFGLLILAPQMFGVTTEAAEPYAFLLFLLTYGGLAVGIMRYRLFELGAWWGRIMAWMLALALLAGLDLLFLFGLQLSTEISLSLALLIAGMAWLPLRGWVASRLVRRRDADDRAVFEGVVQIGLSAAREDQLAAWVDVLRRRFDPLRLDVAEDAAGRAGLDSDGLALVTPPVAGLPALRLEYANGGRGLFSPADVDQAQALADMVAFVVESRDAYARGAAVERRRIAGDLHDHLGANLLSALHSRDGARKDRYIRETLADLRSIVTAPASEADLAQTLAGARKEMAERLEARDVRLDWAHEALPSDALAPSAAPALRAILRELTNNTIKHAEASRVLVHFSMSPEDFTVVVEDDGRGFDPGRVAEGAGLSGLRERVGRLGGRIEWAAAEPHGVRVTVILPRGG